jgi:S1-C subfamily serine protease
MEFSFIKAGLDAALLYRSNHRSRYAAIQRQPSSSRARQGLPSLRLFRIATAMVVLSLAAMSCPAASNLLTPESRRDLELQPGVVLIDVSFESSWHGVSCHSEALGSGFLYRPDGYLITNGHVAQFAHADDNVAAAARLKNAERCLAKKLMDVLQKHAGRDLTSAERDKLAVMVFEAGQNHEISIGGFSLKVFLANGDSYTGEIKAYSSPASQGGKDVAIIKIDGKNLPTESMGNSEEVNVGDEITVIGYPGAATDAAMDGLISPKSLLVPTVTNGRISAKRVDGNGTPVLQSEAAINHGNSGGPAFDEKGNVIGIATWALTDASSLNFFIPIDTAMEFVHQAGAPPERGVFDKQWHDALDAYYNQRWSEAHDKFSSVLETLPKLPDAQKYAALAMTNVPANPILALIDRVGMPIVLGIGVVVILIIAGVIWSLVAKRHPHSVPPPPPLPADRRNEFSPPGPVQTLEAPKTITAHQQSFGTLQITTGPLAGNRFLIPKSGLLIGRDSTRCAVVLPDESVGREHAWVVPLDNGVAVIDRDSTNGTYLNSVDSPRISKMVLKDGDRIFIGHKTPTSITYFSS